MKKKIWKTLICIEIFEKIIKKIEIFNFCIKKYKTNFSISKEKFELFLKNFEIYFLIILKNFEIV